MWNPLWVRPKSAADLQTSLYRRKTIKVLEWPSQSTDMLCRDKQKAQSKTWHIWLETLSDANFSSHLIIIHKYMDKNNTSSKLFTYFWNPSKKFTVMNERSCNLTTECERKHWKKEAWGVFRDSNQQLLWLTINKRETRQLEKHHCGSSPPSSGQAGTLQHSEEQRKEQRREEVETGAQIFFSGNQIRDEYMETATLLCFVYGSRTTGVWVLNEFIIY